jgi:hypothetical protein
MSGGHNPRFVTPDSTASSRRNLAILLRKRWGKWFPGGTPNDRPLSHLNMSYSASWHTLLEQIEELPADATLLTPVTHKALRITGSQDHRVIVEYEADDDTRPLQRDQFETLLQRVGDAPGNAFDLDRLPADAAPYAAVLSLHPRYEIDETDGVLRESDTASGTQVFESDSDTESDDDVDEEWAEPDLQVYSDALLLTDTLERLAVGDLTGLETDSLVDLYTICSDVQRSADNLRKEIADVLLNRLHHDRPFGGQFGSVQRTSRRNRSLKDDETVLERLQAAGIDREQVTSVDRSKVDDALDVTDLNEDDVYDVETTEYVRKAEVDEDTKETRLQGLKDRLAASDEDDEEVEQLQKEIAELEDRIEELTSFKSGQAFHTRSGAE